RRIRAKPGVRKVFSRSSGKSNSVRSSIFSTSAIASSEAASSPDALTRPLSIPLDISHLVLTGRPSYCERIGHSLIERLGLVHPQPHQHVEHCLPHQRLLGVAVAGETLLRPLGRNHHEGSVADSESDRSGGHQ